MNGIPASVRASILLHSLSGIMFLFFFCFPCFRKKKGSKKPDDRQLSAYKQMSFVNIWQKSVCQSASTYVIMDGYFQLELIGSVLIFSTWEMNYFQIYHLDS